MIWKLDLTTNYSYKIHAEDPRLLKIYECIGLQKQMAFILYIYSRIEKVSSKTCLWHTDNFWGNDFILFRRNPACQGFRQVINLPRYDGESSSQSSGRTIHQKDPVCPVCLHFPLSLEFIGKKKWGKRWRWRGQANPCISGCIVLFCVLGVVDPLCNPWLIQKCDPNKSKLDSAVFERF